MSSIKKHQCPSCGGSLIIDNDKQMYHCTFCGSTYDYEYFREDQTIRMGDKYLARGEFVAAADAYKFTLSKDPHDFLALRGLMLAAANLNDMNDLIREDHTRGFMYDAGLVDDAVEGASEADKEYFNELKKIYSDMKDLSEIYGEIDSLNASKKTGGEEIRSKEVERKDCYIENRDVKDSSPKTRFIINWFIYGGFVLITLPMMLGSYIRHDYSYTNIFINTIIFILYILIPILNFTVVFTKIPSERVLTRTIKEIAVETEKIGEKVKVLASRAEKIEAGLRLSRHDFVKRDRLVMRDRNPS